MPDEKEVDDYGMLVVAPAEPAPAQPELSSEGVDAAVAQLRGLLAAVMNNPDTPKPIAAMIGEELRKLG